MLSLGSSSSGGAKPLKEVIGIKVFHLFPCLVLFATRKYSKLMIRDVGFL